jgi:rod shape-determining protein MreD
MSNGIKYFLLFLGMIFLQVIVFNKIHLFGVATPLIYIYFILKLPFDLNRNTVLVLSSLLGLSVDLLSSTIGLNMLACTVIGFIRYYFMRLAPQDLLPHSSPSLYSFGFGFFFRYVIIMMLAHHSVLFFAESFSLFDLSHVLLRIGGSSLFTLIMIFAFEFLIPNKNKK